MMKGLLSFKKSLAFLILAFLILTFFAKSFRYFDFDLTVTNIVQSIHLPWFNYLMVIVSKFGDNGWGSLSIIIFTLILLSLKQKIEALILLFSVIVIHYLTPILKNFVARPRPDPDLINQTSFFGSFDSFPSGHVLFFMSVYGVLLFLAHIKIKKTALKIIISSILVIWLILIGLSRIYLGAHWFSDVIGSYLFGAIWLLIIVHLYHKL